MALVGLWLVDVLNAAVLSFFIRGQVRILQDLDHPNVIKIYNFFHNDPQYFYMTLEMMRGGELFDRVVEKVRFCCTLSTYIKRVESSMR